MTINPSIKEELKEYLDTQIEKKVKSIQIKHLKDHFLTREEFLERMDKSDKRFEAMQEQMDKRFERVYQRFDQMDFGHTDVVEGMAYIVIKRALKERGHDIKIKTRQHFTDEQNYVHPDTNDVEIDILHISPNIIGEATLKLTDIEKIRTFIRKIQYIESYYGEKFERYFFCYTVYDNIKAEVNSLLEKYQIELIIPEIDQKL